jgi:hypothetical protein
MMWTGLPNSEPHTHTAHPDRTRVQIPESQVCERVALRCVAVRAAVTCVECRVFGAVCLCFGCACGLWLCVLWLCKVRC